MIENTTTILIFFAVGIGAILFFVNKWIKDLKDQAKVSNEVVEWLKDVGERIDTSNKNIDSKLGSSMEQFNTRLDRAAEIIGKVQKNIGEFSEIGRGMRDLQEFLKSPKIRGNIGEAVLKDLLEQLLPKSNFKMQYRFKGGEIVDAVIKTSRG